MLQEPVSSQALARKAESELPNVNAWLMVLLCSSCNDCCCALQLMQEAFAFCMQKVGVWGVCCK